MWCCLCVALIRCMFRRCTEFTITTFALRSECVHDQTRKSRRTESLLLINNHLVRPFVLINEVADQLPKRDSGALFVDRDGTIIEDTGYPVDPECIRFISSIIELLQLATMRGVPIVVVSNQSGVGRGYFGWQNVSDFNRRLIEQLVDIDVVISVIISCSYIDNGTNNPSHGYYRKPNPGMFFVAKKRYRVDLSKSFMIGDKVSDVEAAERAGLQFAILVGSAEGGGEMNQLRSGFCEGSETGLSRAMRAIRSLTS